jgi:hypothetical protein
VHGVGNEAEAAVGVEQGEGGCTERVHCGDWLRHVRERARRCSGRRIRGPRTKTSYAIAGF